MIQISKRLQQVASFVTEGNRLVDVGTDHGYVPIWLLQQKRVPFAIGMDVRKGPLERATEHRKLCGLEHQLELRLSDGLKGFNKGEADSIVIAGMGGELMIRILSEGIDKITSVKELVLSPQSEIAQVRHYLSSVGFSIDQEAFLEEDGKYYVVIHAVLGESDYLTDVEFYYGKRNLENPSEAFVAYLEKEERICQSLMGQLDEQNPRQKERKDEMRRKFLLIKEAQSSLQKK